MKPSTILPRAIAVLVICVIALWLAPAGLTGDRPEDLATPPQAKADEPSPQNQEDADPFEFNGVRWSSKRAFVENASCATKLPEQEDEGEKIAYQGTLRGSSVLANEETVPENIVVNVYVHVVNKVGQRDLKGEQS